MNYFLKFKLFLSRIQFQELVHIRFFELISHKSVLALSWVLFYILLLEFSSLVFYAEVLLSVGALPPPKYKTSY